MINHAFSFLWHITMEGEIFTSLECAVVASIVITWGFVIWTYIPEREKHE